MWIFPSSLGSVVKTPSSTALRAVLASPFESSAKKPTASSSIIALYTPIPFSASLTALYISVLILSAVSGCSSKIIDLDIKAVFTSKYGFSVVAPIKITVPSSTKGNR